MLGLTLFHRADLHRLGPLHCSCLCSVARAKPAAARSCQTLGKCKIRLSCKGSLAFLSLLVRPRSAAASPCWAARHSARSDPLRRRAQIPRSLFVAHNDRRLCAKSFKASIACSPHSARQAASASRNLVARNPAFERTGQRPAAQGQR